MAEFTQDWFSQNIPIWNQVLAEFKEKDIKAVELGSFEGRSAVWLAENILTKNSELVCVDDFKAVKSGTGGEFPIDMQAVKKRFLINTAPYPQISFWDGKSEDYLKQRKEPFDFIYIDAGHTASETLINGVLAHFLLKKDGIMIFDDYLWNGMAGGPLVPKDGIDAFITCFCTEYRMPFIGYQAVLKRVI